jgi:hypothetical protein
MYRAENSKPTEQKTWSWVYAPILCARVVRGEINPMICCPRTDKMKA